jgi:UDP-N-acetylglucosamine 2-epimerase (non-hydrolysing)
LVAAKVRHSIEVPHRIEAGLRSCDWSMPEEVNRVATDRLSDLLLISGGGGRQPRRRGAVGRPTGSSAT